MNAAHTTARACTCHIAPATRADFLAGFATLSDAFRFEADVLFGGGTLPHEALDVRSGREPTPAYWCWLIGQSEAA
jgi:hypothetical protein